MTNRFPTTSTNQMVQFAASHQTQAFDRLRVIDQQIQDLIRNFNPGIEGMFKAGSAEGLAPFCTGAGIERIRGKYANWTAQNLSALNLVSCAFLSFDLNEAQDRAQVFTFEKWVFVYADGKEVPTKGSVDGYDVHRVDGRWVVDSVNTYALGG